VGLGYDGLVKSRHYWKAVEAFKTRLREAVPHDELKALHVRSGPRHLAYAARQFAIIGACSYALWHLASPLLWVPFAVLQGFTFFNMTTLLHEVVHSSVFGKRRPGWNRALGLLYATTSGISASQFTRWHLDHHDNLGSWDDDPKRHWLSPKRNARWYKLLYCTPALFPIYFRAARIESSTYPEPLRRRIRFERNVSIVSHLTALGLLWYFFGFYAALRTSIIPVFFVFPVAFTLNRLGQHYDIDPTDPAKWGTLMRGHWFWDFVFLNSNYHLEHHYFPGVPFYRLPQLQQMLKPFYAKKGMRWRTYGELVYGWIVENQVPHTDWAATNAARKAGSVPHISFH
jgi:fatty acid desaturase